MTQFNIEHILASPAILNPEKLTKHIEKNHSRAAAIIEIIEHLIADDTRPIHEVRKAIKRSQPHQAAHMLNSLKASIGNIGGMRVFAIADELEKQLDETSSSDSIIESLMEYFDKEYCLFLSAAKNWLGLQQANLPSAEALQAASDQSKIKNLKQHLANNNIKACDIFEESKELLQSTLDTEDYQGLNSSIELLEFEKALTCIQNI